MASVRRTVTLPLAFVVCVLAVAGLAATPGVAVGESLGAAGFPGLLRHRGLARPRPVHRTADPAGPPQRGLRPRYAGWPVWPADPRRDSRFAAVAGSATDGVPERRGGGASANGRATAGTRSAHAGPSGARRRPQRVVGRDGTRLHPGGDRLQSGVARHRCRRRSRSAERRHGAEHPAAAGRRRRGRHRPTAARNPD